MSYATICASVAVQVLFAFGAVSFSWHWTQFAWPTVVHGWSDEVVPYAHSVQFAQSYLAALHLLDSDHLLHNQIRVIQHLFEYFLIALDLPAIAFA